MKTAKAFTTQQLEAIRSVVREKLNSPFRIDDVMRQRIQEGVEQLDRGETVSDHKLERELNIDLS